MQIDNSGITQQLVQEQRIQHAKTTINERRSEIKSEEPLHREEVEKVIQELNDFSKPMRTNLKFQLHDTLREYYVTVVDPITDEIIKEIPPKKLLDMYAGMAEFMGLFVDAKA